MTKQLAKKVTPRKRRYWLVFVPGQPSEVDGVVYETWNEALSVLRKAVDALTPAIKDEWGAAIGPVYYTKAEYLRECIEVDV